MSPMKPARYVGVSRCSVDGGPRSLIYGDYGVVDDSDPRVIRFVQKSGDVWGVCRSDIYYLPTTTFDLRALILAAALVALVAWAAVSIGGAL